MTKIMTIEGMMCQHCQARVEQALLAVKGVKGVVIDLEAKTATVEAGLLVTDKTLTQAVTAAGYQVVEVK